MSKLFIFIVVVAISCFSTQGYSQEKQKPVGKAKKTANPHVPYIYKNGYKDYVIRSTNFELDGKQLTANELRFNATQSAMYCEWVMFSKFGKSNQEIAVDIPAKGRIPAYTKHIRIWKNIKLFENESTMFTIICNGTEDWEQMFSSVKVLAQNGDDMLKPDSHYKAILISFFSEGIKNLNEKDLQELFKM